jgi:hypothetical protein
MKAANNSTPPSNSKKDRSAALTPLVRKKVQMTIDVEIIRHPLPPIDKLYNIGHKRGMAMKRGQCRQPATLVALKAPRSSDGYIKFAHIL